MFCTAGQVVVVEQAVYGVIEGNPCNSSTLNPCLSNQAIVTVNRQCTGTPGCGFIVRHSQFTGLCPQDNNALLVKYRCVSGKYTLNLITINGIGLILFLFIPGVGYSNLSPASIHSRDTLF